MCALVYLLLIAILLIWYLAKPFYWKKRNIPYLTTLPLIGSLLPIIECGTLNYFKQLNKKFPGHKYFGMHFLTRPTIYVKDPKIIQSILSKDFEYFTSHGFYSNQDRDPGGGNLFLLYGQQWKEMRKKLSQYFTPAKIKAMLDHVDNTMFKLGTIFDKKIAQGIPCEMNSLLLSSTTDVITQSIFGVESDAFKNDNSIFNKIIKKMFKPRFTLKIYTSIVSSKLYDILNLTMFEPAFNTLITSIIQETIEYRRKNNIYKQDFLQGMIELLDTSTDKEINYFPDKTRVPNYNLATVISQAIVLYVGAVETTALAMTFFLYEVALNHDIQDKCRREVNSTVINDEPLNIKDLSKLTYLTAALQETMRKHSPFTMITRECTKKYKFPDSDLIIDPGTFVLISPSSMHMEEEYFPEPHIFRPERFLDDERNTITPGSYFPFGLGPRTCIGMNFALGEMKLILGRLLQRYEFHICTKTQVPVEYGKYLFLTTPAEGVWLQLKPVQIPEN